MNDECYITRLSAWANGIAGSDEWDDWARGKREICGGEKGPEISFTEPMFRRRLSQISKMTIQVIHDLLPIEENTKIFFLSFRGEISRQLQINKMLIQEKDISPAAFSLSVFNAPVALATMALQLKGGYTALYPGNDSFTTGLIAAQAAILCGEQEIVFVYADEQAPPEYAPLTGTCPVPLSFGLLLSNESCSNSVPLSSIIKEQDNPFDFLKRLLLGGEIHAAA